MTPGLISPNANTADQYSVTKPRMRICFDPETEIPKLQKWFAENNHPTRQQVYIFLHRIDFFPNKKKFLLYLLTIFLRLKNM